MKYELEALEQFIEYAIALNNEAPIDILFIEFDEKKSFVQDEVVKLKKLFTSYLFEAESERRLELFVLHHQTKIISLADRLSECIDVNGGPTPVRHPDRKTNLDLCRLAYQSLEELLTFIETYFSKYFDLDQKIPDTYMLLERRSLKEMVGTLTEKANETNVCSRLTEIALFPLTDFANEDSGKNISYRRLIYLKGLVRDISSLLQKEGEADLKFELIKLLVYRNFNSHYFLVYVTDNVRTDIHNQPTIAAQLDKLNYWLKLLYQFQVKPDSALKYGKPSIKDQLATWLTEEINYLEKKKQLTLMLPPSEPLDETESFKVGTICSVSQLACILLKETGLITNKNQTELIAFFSKHYSSIRNENISSDSLRVKYYNIEKATLNAVQLLLERMIEHSKKGRWLIFYVSGDLMADLVMEVALEGMFL
jgi:hypothetical protein